MNMRSGQITEASPDEAWKEFVMDVLPSQGDWSDDAYLWLTDNTKRLVELTDGYLEILPMPTDHHQTILQFLFLAFHRFVEPRGGKVHFAPLRLRIREGKFREPDMLLVLDADDPRRQDRVWSGADLVLEVVSPDGKKRDIKEKRADYAEGGVSEYWIVDPQEETIAVLTLQKGKYRVAGEYGRGESATSNLLAGFAVDVSAAFDAK
jgi:Uma2 family endonuclease